MKQANRELKESVVRKIRDHSEMSLLSRMLFLRAAARVRWFVILMTFLATLPVCATHRFQVSRKPWRLPAGEEDEISRNRNISKRNIPIHPRAALRRRGPKSHRRFVREMSVHADSFPGEHRWRKAHVQAGEAPLSESGIQPRWATHIRRLRSGLLSTHQSAQTRLPKDKSPCESYRRV